MTLWSRRIEKSRGNLKALYLHYCKAYGRQIWQEDNLSWETSTHKITWPYHQVVLRDHVTN